MNKAVQRGSIVHVVLDDPTFTALQARAEREWYTVETWVQRLVRTYLGEIGTGVALLLLLAIPALASDPVIRCQTYAERSMQRLQTVCSDGSRATSYWSPTLQTWQTTITPPGKRCNGQVHPRTRQWEGSCR